MDWSAPRLLGLVEFQTSQGDIAAHLDGNFVNSQVDWWNSTLTLAIDSVTQVSTPTITVAQVLMVYGGAEAA